MLTRSQVARRLGKSIATVRRLEGVELFPEKDYRGVNQFREHEVESVRREIKNGLLSVPRGSIEKYPEVLNTSRQKKDCQRLVKRVEILEETIQILGDFLAASFRQTP